MNTRTTLSSAASWCLLLVTGLSSGCTGTGVQIASQQQHLDENPCLTAECDDTNDCTSDWCEEWVGCHNDTVTDGELCDGESGQCQSGTCVPDPCVNTNCDDANECTSDWCEPMVGCHYDAVTDGQICDGNSGQCQGGACAPDPCAFANCNDANDCTDDWCEPMVGCHNDAMADGLQCDGNTGQCQTGTCVPDPCTWANCNDENDCTDDWCQAMVGCQHDAVGNGSMCAGGTGMCTSGSCSIDPCLTADCDDLNDCTGDWCDAFVGCNHAPLADNTQCNADTGLCVSGLCQFDPCTSADCDDQNDCTADSCTPLIGCQHTPVGDGASCEGGNGQCQTGTCNINPCVSATCDDENECTADSCTPMVGCQYTPVENATWCDGGNGQCQSGSCMPDPCATESCDDENDCTADSCTPMVGCQHDAIENGTWCSGGSGQCEFGTCMPDPCYGASCDDANDCTDETCVTMVGCVYTPTTDGTSCDGGSGQCQSGACAADPCYETTCDDANECTDDICTTMVGCEYSPVVDGTTCDGGNGTCQSGSCIPNPCASMNCDDENECTNDWCDPVNATCLHDDVADGTSCTGGTCYGGVCEPWDPCWSVYTTPDPANSCASAVCSVESTCCDYWDASCVEIAAVVCGINCYPPPDGGYTSHSPCQAGDPLPSSQDVCVADVCAVMPGCCTDTVPAGSEPAWNTACVAWAENLCGCTLPDGGDDAGDDAGGGGYDAAYDADTPDGGADLASDMSLCGNGTIDEGEECDPGVDGGDPFCGNDCKKLCKGPGQADPAKDYASDFDEVFKDAPAQGAEGPVLPEHFIEPTFAAGLPEGTAELQAKWVNRQVGWYKVLKNSRYCDPPQGEAGDSDGEVECANDKKNGRYVFKVRVLAPLAVFEVAKNSPPTIITDSVGCMSIPPAAIDVEFRKVDTQAKGRCDQAGFTVIADLRYGRNALEEGQRQKTACGRAPYVTSPMFARFAKANDVWGVAFNPAPDPVGPSNIRTILEPAFTVGPVSKNSNPARATTGFLLEGFYNNRYILAPANKAAAVRIKVRDTDRNNPYVGANTRDNTFTTAAVHPNAPLMSTAIRTLAKEPAGATMTAGGLPIRERLWETLREAQKLGPSQLFTSVNGANETPRTPPALSAPQPIGTAELWGNGNYNSFFLPRPLPKIPENQTDCAAAAGGPDYGNFADAWLCGLSGL